MRWPRIGTGWRRATRTGIAVALTKPGIKNIGVDRAVVFPTEQMKRVLAAAADGEHFLAMDVYDGSQTGELVYATATVIGKSIDSARRFR